MSAFSPGEEPDPVSGLGFEEAVAVVVALLVAVGIAAALVLA